MRPRRGRAGCRWRSFPVRSPDHPRSIRGTAKAERPSASVHRASDEAVDFYVNDLMANPAWGVPNLRHGAVCAIWLSPAAAKVIDDGLGGDIEPLCAHPYLITTLPVRLFAGPPFIVAESVPVRSPATSNFRYWLNVAFPPEMLGIIWIDAGRWQGERRGCQQGEGDGGGSHDRSACAHSHRGCAKCDARNGL